MLWCRLAVVVSGFFSGILSASDGSPLHLAAPAGRLNGFQRLATNDTGITFAHLLPTARSLTNQMLLDGAGVALADVDGDGRVDIFFGANNGGSQLWRNLGDWRFQPGTDAAFPQRQSDLAGDITGVAFADLNGDRNPDLLANTHAHGLRILINDGHGAFRRLPFAQARARGGHSVAVADVDGDGWLDIYVCNYRQRALMDMPSARATFRTAKGALTVATIDGRPTSEPDLTNRFVVTPSGGLEELGEPDVLYRNLGGTNFLELPWTQGAFLDEDGRPLAAPPFDWGLAAQFCDVNDDGRPDLYVCNDFQTPDRFWFNESSPGLIRFRLAARTTVRHTSLFSMGVDFADLNRDARWDFAVLDMLSPDHVRRLTTLDETPSAGAPSVDRFARPQSDANTLFLQRGDGSFADVAPFAGVMATDWSWTPVFLDVDLDGWVDLLVTAGQERGSRDLDMAEHMKEFRKAGLRTDAQILRERQKFPDHHAPLRAFRNRGSPQPNSVPRFDDVGSTWGFDFHGVSHGMALADLDGDGDLDVVVNHLQSPAGMYRNETQAPRIALHLKGRAPNTAAVGARLRFWWITDSVTNPLPQSAQVVVGGHYLSSDDVTRTFACPGSGRGLLEIRWPSGQITSQSNLVANHRYEVDEPVHVPTDSQPALRPPSPPPRLRFEPVAIDARWDTTPGGDFVVQPSLPRRISPRSPHLALPGTNAAQIRLWMGGPEHPLQEVLISLGKPGPTREVGAVRAFSAVIPWGDDLLVASDAWAARSEGRSTVALLNPHTGQERAIPVATSAVSCLVASAQTGTNGTYCLVGGGALPGDYPKAAPSELLQFQGGQLQSRAVTNLGLVTAALFANLDSDPALELVTVSEWGTPRILHGPGPELVGWDAPVKWGRSPPARLSSLTGWWQSLAAADLDRDGRVDLVLGNWGLNSAYSLYTGQPSAPDESLRALMLFQANFDAGMDACLEGYTAVDGRRLPIHGLTQLSPHLPWIRGQFPTHRSFALASLDQILGGHSKTAGQRECRWLSSLLLLNRGDHFEARSLPDLAQLGPLTAIQVADFNGDGRVDLYGAQGFFGHNFGVPRDDAGEGCFLLGRGDGDFDAVTTIECGFRLVGEQRSVLARDLDGDQQPDLVVGEHGGPVTLLFNRTR